MTESRDPTIDMECPCCGSLPADRATHGDYLELHECPWCGGRKCAICDVGDDCSCLNCEGEDL